MHEKFETICVAWCDNGNTDGSFTYHLSQLILNGEQNGIPIYGILRSNGNQLNKQRNEIIGSWYNAGKHPWLLFVDSDILIEIDKVKKLWDVADRLHNPMVSGIYYLFNNQNKENPLPQASSSVFRTNNNYKTIESIDIKEESDIFQADAVGFGFLLIHRNVIDNLIKTFGNSTNFFLERAGDNSFIGEDIHFCKYVKESKTPITVVKDATVQHMKRFSLGIEYFDLLNTKNV